MSHNFARVCSTGTIASKNKFVQLALLHTLSFALERKVPAESVTRGLDIVIAGDNDFYSQRAKVSHASLIGPMHSLIFGHSWHPWTSLEPCHPCRKYLLSA